MGRTIIEWSNINCRFLLVAVRGIGGWVRKQDTIDLCVYIFTANITTYVESVVTSFRIKIKDGTFFVIDDTGYKTKQYKITR